MSLGVLLLLSDLTGLPAAVAQWGAWAEQLSADQVRLAVFTLGALLVLWPAVIQPNLWPEIKRWYALLRRPTLEFICASSEPFVEHHSTLEQYGPPQPDYTCYRFGLRNNSRKSIEGVRVRLVRMVPWNFNGIAPPKNLDLPQLSNLYLRLAQDRSDLSGSLSGVTIDPGQVPVMFELAHVDERAHPRVVRFEYANAQPSYTPQSDGYRLTVEATARDRHPSRGRLHFVPSARSLVMPTPQEVGWL